MPPVPLTASWPLKSPRSVQLPGAVVPLPPDQDQGTVSELLAHSITMPEPVQVVEPVSVSPELELELELDDGIVIGVVVAGDGDDDTTGAATGATASFSGATTGTEVEDVDVDEVEGALAAAPGSS